MAALKGQFSRSKLSPTLGSTELALSSFSACAVVVHNRSSSPYSSRQVGRNGLAPRETVIKHLRHLAAGESAFFEKQRQRRFSTALSQLREEAQRQPRVLVEAPTTIVKQEFEDLPAGVHLNPGRIVIDGFKTPEDAQRKLLALVMAMGNDPLGFEFRIAVR